jgi:hypothetical protein
MSAIVIAGRFPQRETSTKDRIVDCVMTALLEIDEAVGIAMRDTEAAEAWFAADLRGMSDDLNRLMVRLCD